MTNSKIISAIVAIVGGIIVSSTSAHASGCFGGSTKDDVSVPSFWSGAYVGVNAGYSWSDVDFTDGTNSVSYDVDGGVYGGHIGYTWQCGQFAWGLEADIGVPDADKSVSDGATTTLTISSDYLASVRGRVGYASDQYFVYATGGVAFSKLTLKVVDTAAVGAVNASLDTSVTGYVIGAGGEFRLLDHLSGRVEVLHYGGLDGSFNFPGGRLSEDVDTTVLRGGLTYHFN